MGRVYSTAEIRDGQVPEDTSAHLASRDELLHLIGNNIDPNEGVHGALVYGSVAAETPTIRSDLDILIACYDLSVVRSLRHIFEDVYGRHHVTIEPNIWLSEALSRGAHTIDSAFREHLLMVPLEGNFVGASNPAELVETGPINSQVMFDYLSKKSRSLTGGFMGYDPLGKDQKPLQRALELPVSVGRKFLTVAKNEGLVDSAPDSTQKRAVTLAFQEFFGDNAKVMELFSGLVARNGEYSDLLDSTLRGEATLAQYGEQLSLLGRDTIWLALEWTNELEKAMRLLFEEKLPQDVTAAQ